jgi:hypothetical protein
MFNYENSIVKGNRETIKVLYYFKNHIYIYENMSTD